MELYTRAVQRGAKPSKTAAMGNGGAGGDSTDVSKMTPIEGRKEMARRRQQEQKEKARKVVSCVGLRGCFVGEMEGALEA